MKYFASALVVLALIGTPVSAIKIRTSPTEDLVKSLAEDLNTAEEAKDEEPKKAPVTKAAPSPPKKPEGAAPA